MKQPEMSQWNERKQLIKIIKISFEGGLQVSENSPKSTYTSLHYYFSHVDHPNKGSCKNEKKKKKTTLSPP